MIDMLWQRPPFSNMMRLKLKKRVQRYSSLTGGNKSTSPTPLLHVIPNFIWCRLLCCSNSKWDDKGRQSQLVGTDSLLRSVIFPISLFFVFAQYMKRTIHACLQLHQMTDQMAVQQICFLFFFAPSRYLEIISNSHLIT